MTKLLEVLYVLGRMGSCATFGVAVLALIQALWELSLSPMTYVYISVAVISALIGFATRNENKNPFAPVEDEEESA